MVGLLVAHDRDPGRPSERAQVESHGGAGGRRRTPTEPAGLLHSCAADLGQAMGCDELVEVRHVRREGRAKLVQLSLERCVELVDALARGPTVGAIDDAVQGGDLVVSWIGRFNGSSLACRLVQGSRPRRDNGGSRSSPEIRRSWAVCSFQPPWIQAPATNSCLIAMLKPAVLAIPVTDVEAASCSGAVFGRRCRSSKTRRRRIWVTRRGREPPHRSLKKVSLAMSGMQDIAFNKPYTLSSRGNTEIKFVKLEISVGIRAEKVCGFLAYGRGPRRKASRALYRMVTRICLRRTSLGWLQDLVMTSNTVREAHGPPERIAMSRDADYAKSLPR
jgi:hypothetical protein